jgi:PPE-repeat protein
MFGFEVLPPEINSGLMYTGPGAGPMTAAAAAWNALADDLYLVAAGYGSAISDLTSYWLGPSSAAMAAASATYVSWIGATATQAQQTAAQATAAVAAYEAAFAMTVPPAVIAANRALLLALVATNFFGQNTPAIMATEADYLEMWAQDVAAMCGYAGASSAASTITPFTTPMETTHPSELTGVTAAVTQAAGTSAGTGVQTVSPLATAAMPGSLQALASSATSSTSTTSPLSSLAVSTSTSSSSTALTTGASVASGTTSGASMLTSAVSMLGSSGAAAKSVGPAGGALSGGFPMFKTSLEIGAGPGTATWGSPELTVSATSGRAASLGALSVPQGWTSAAPAFSHVSSALPSGAGGPRPVLPVAPAAQPGPLGVPRVNPTTRSESTPAVPAHHYFRPAVVQRPVYTG